METTTEVKSSRLPGFYKLPLAERVAVVAAWAGLTEEESAVLAGDGLTPAQADHMVENALGTFELPLGVAANFLINGRDYLIPMAVEEPSVLAAVRKHLEIGRFKVLDAIASLAVREVVLDRPHHFMNVNRPEDWEALHVRG